MTLTDFEGLPVRQAGVEIPGAAGGLREAMKIEPQEFHKGERVYVVLECVVGKIRHDPVSKDEPDGDQRRVHIMDVDEATIVEESLVREHLDRQKAKNAEAKRQREIEAQKAKDEAQGIGRLDGEPGQGQEWDDTPGPLDEPDGKDAVGEGDAWEDPTPPRPPTENEIAQQNAEPGDGEGEPDPDPGDEVGAKRAKRGSGG